MSDGQGVVRPGSFSQPLIRPSEEVGGGVVLVVLVVGAIRGEEAEIHRSGSSWGRSCSKLI